MTGLSTTTRVTEQTTSRTWARVAPAVAMAAWGGNHFTPLLQLYREREGFTPVQVDLLLAFYVVGLTPAFLVAGRAATRFGPKRVMLVALGIGVLASGVLATASGSMSLLCAGRFLAGLSVATAMVVGTSWIRALSAAPWDLAASEADGARRASMSLTLGLGVGAGVSGVLAQWGPLPTLTPYIVQIGCSVVAACLLLRAAQPDLTRSTIRERPPIPAIARRHFVGVVLPVAPWVFAAGALAYAVTPQFVDAAVAPRQIGFATLLTVVTLGVGTVIQPFTHVIAARSRHHNALIGLELVAVGCVLCAVDADVRSPGLAIVVATVLGLAFGICMVSGLVEIQRLARPEHLPTFTGVFYCLTYLGFVLPVLLAGLHRSVSYPGLLAATAIAAILCAFTVARNLRRLAVSEPRRGPRTRRR